MLKHCLVRCQYRDMHHSQLVCVFELPKWDKHPQIGEYQKWMQGLYSNVKVIGLPHNKGLCLLHFSFGGRGNRNHTEVLLTTTCRIVDSINPS